MLPHVFVVVWVYRFLQQRQQVVKATGEILLLHLHEQTTNLSPETLQAGLRERGGGVRGLNEILNELYKCYKILKTFMLKLLKKRS